MSKKNKRLKSVKPSTSRSMGQTGKKTRRKLIKAAWVIFFIFVFASASAFAINMYKKKWDKYHDLSVIGNGKPTIVQVHDPKCPQCKELQANTLKAITDYKSRIQFKIADISTGPGRKLQRDHEARIVTLLMFDAKGSLKRSLAGVKTVNTLENEFDDFLKKYDR